MNEALPCFVYKRSSYSEKDGSVSAVINGIQLINGLREEDGSVQSEFERLLFSRWKNAMEKGCFRYTLDHVKCRVLCGKQGFVAQFNDKRTTKRRKPPPITDIRQPFNPNNFNFNKIKDSEKLFSLYPEENTTLQGAVKSSNLVIINDSPVDVGHVLMVPSIDECLPQVLTEGALSLALDMMLLSKHRGFRVCWNSLGALASVNHLHFHAMYLDHPLLVEKIDATHLGNGCYEIMNQPTRGFAFQLHGGTPDSLVKLVFKVTSYLTDKQVPHNLCMSRGGTFPLDDSFLTADKNNPELSTFNIRVLLWPKKPMFDLQDDPPFSNACIEPAGFLVIKDFDSYASLTEDEANYWLGKYSLDEDEFKCLKENLSVFLEENPRKIKL